MASTTLPRLTNSLCCHFRIPLNKIPLLTTTATTTITPSPQSTRAYHSHTRPNPPPPFTPTAQTILSSSLPHVPTHGFTPTSLLHGARDAGYLDATLNLFPRGAFDLVYFYLVTQRLGLRDRVIGALEKEELDGAWERLEKRERVRRLIFGRLMGNWEDLGEGAGVRWQELLTLTLGSIQALALMALPPNVPTSVAELAKLADEICYLAGDESVDPAWYGKRAAIAGVYSSSEVFMTQDSSPGFVETERFIDRRLDDVSGIGNAVGSLGQWTGFTAHAAVNVLRSRGVRI
ncbi:MAG: hypothetical protein M1819_005766 [Sarea resinae]|nr:MAG: hypothetical protein M1819_005766 [Sarea resinae]